MEDTNNKIENKRKENWFEKIGRGIDEAPERSIDSIKSYFAKINNSRAFALLISIYGIAIVSLLLILRLLPNTSVANTGTLGDTFGGLLSPLIGIITIFYVWRSYQKQLETHELDIMNSNYQSLMSLVDDINDHLKPDIDSKYYKILKKIYKQQIEQQDEETLDYYYIDDYNTEYEIRAKKYFSNRLSLIDLGNILSLCLLIHKGLIKHKITELQKEIITKRLELLQKHDTIKFLGVVKRNSTFPGINYKFNEEKLKEYENPEERVRIFNIYKEMENLFIRIVEIVFKF